MKVLLHTFIVERDKGIFKILVRWVGCYIFKRDQSSCQNVKSLTVSSILLAYPWKPMVDYTNILAHLTVAPLTQQTQIQCQARRRPGGYKYESDENLCLQRAHILLTTGVVLSPRSSGNLWGISVVTTARCPK